jgi:hypothetical protein
VLVWISITTVISYLTTFIRSVIQVYEPKYVGLTDNCRAICAVFEVDSISTTPPQLYSKASVFN